jgi:Calcium-binding EGF domain
MFRVLILLLVLAFATLSGGEVRTCLQVAADTLLIFNGPSLTSLLCRYYVCPKTATTQHELVRTTVDKQSQSRRELILGFQLEDYCMLDGSQYRTVRRRPLFRLFTRRSNMVRGKCNACPCDGGPNEVCDVSTNLCVCRKGYAKDANSVCADVNECLVILGAPPPCKPGKKCINLPGNYTCNACPCSAPNEVCDVSTNLCVCRKGYAKDANDVCADINECLVILGAPLPCKPGKTCTNLPGNYTCNACPCSAPNERCNTATNTCVCQPGFELDSMSGECVDVDECRQATLNATDLCGVSKTCNNTAGSYACIACPCEGCTNIAFLSTCTCAPGFIRPNVTKVVNITKTVSVNVTTTVNVTVPTPVPQPSNCTDVDECAVTPNICSSGKVCKNIVGSYICTDAAPSPSPGGGGGCFCPILCLFTIFLAPCCYGIC